MGSIRGTPMFFIKAYLPVNESFGESKGHGLYDCSWFIIIEFIMAQQEVKHSLSVFDQWPGDPSSL